MQPTESRAGERTTYRNRKGEAWLLNTLGEALGRNGESAGIELLEQALAIRGDIGDRGGEAQAGNNLADVLEAVGWVEDAIDQLQLTLDLRREMGYRYFEGVAFTNLGTALLKLDRVEEAMGYLADAARTLSDTRRPSNTGYALSALGRCYLTQGRHGDALATLRLALDCHHAAGNRHQQALTLSDARPCSGTEREDRGSPPIAGAGRGDL